MDLPRPLHAGSAAGTKLSRAKSRQLHTEIYVFIMIFPFSNLIYIKRKWRVCPLIFSFIYKGVFRFVFISEFARLFILACFGYFSWQLP